MLPDLTNIATRSFCPHKRCRGAHSLDASTNAEIGVQSECNCTFSNLLPRHFLDITQFLRELSNK